MINITDKSACCGCTACANICPKEAIEMVPDEEGFLYPSVDKNSCVECGLCDRVCPIQQKCESKPKKVKSYVLRTKVDDVLMNSTSGGFVTPLAEYVLEHNGIVCAAAYDKDFTVKHIMLESAEKEKLKNIRGSKYVQSDLNDCFKKIKNYLEMGVSVCFIGTTCQVSGLKSFLHKDYEGLITVDLVCHGVPSPKLWSKYIDYQKNKYGSEIREISFRNKTYGYHSGTMKICFSNGKTYFGSARVDYMLKSFFKEIASRPSCYQCRFKTINRCSDYTIYDCWHAAQLVENLHDDDHGYTNVIVQSEKGKRLLTQIQKQYEMYPTDTEKAVELDGIMVKKSANPHPKRNAFYKEIDKKTLPEQICEFIPVSRKDYLIENSKAVIYRAGIYGMLKKLKK